MTTISILGTGRAGGALAIALDRAGIDVEVLIHHKSPAGLLLEKAKQVPLESLAEISTEVLIIATPDPKIRPMAEKIAQFSSLPRVALHLSGSLASDELASLKMRGRSAGLITRYECFTIGRVIP